MYNDETSRWECSRGRTASRNAERCRRHSQPRGWEQGKNGADKEIIKLFAIFHDST
ncbi:hypothetical protein QUF74_14995 [Candidatus Halobeggiatoa sp. HSG11]|nr:hypothetical protein [Candidatus Halobeggiatoa sp. HSG11]